MLSEMNEGASSRVLSRGNQVVSTRWFFLCKGFNFISEGVYIVR